MPALRASSRSCFAASPGDFSAISHWLARQTDHFALIIGQTPDLDTVLGEL
jgi:hypothetical protein